MEKALQEAENLEIDQVVSEAVEKVMDTVTEANEVVDEKLSVIEQMATQQESEEVEEPAPEAEEKETEEPAEEEAAPEEPAEEEPTEEEE